MVIEMLSAEDHHLFYEMDALRILLVFLIAPKLRAQFNFLRTKDLKIERSEPCPDYENNAIQMYNYSNVHISRTIIVMNADIHVLRNITGPLTFEMRVKRCNLDMLKCDDYDTFKVTDVCDKLQQTGAMWSQYSNKIHPPMHCPIEMGKYKLVDGQADYSVTSRLPIDGNRWITYMKIFEEHPKQSQNTNARSDKSLLIKKRSQVWCLDNDVRITLSKTPARPTRPSQSRKHPTRRPTQTSTTSFNIKKN